MQVLLWLLFFTLGTGTAFAGGWTIVPKDLLSPSKKATFQKRFPNINDADHVEELLKELGKSEPFLKLEAYSQGSEWIIEGVKAKVIGEIELNMTTRAFQNPLNSNLYKYIGQVDSPEIRGKLRREVKDYLATRGFYNAQVELKFQTTEDGNVKYLFEIEEDYPCLVREITTGFTVPRSVSLDLAVGDICDQEVVEEAILKLEEELQEAGYNQQRILQGEMKYDRHSNSAAIYIPGTLGKKVRFKVESPEKSFWDSDLEDMDASIVDPDSMTNEIIRKYRNEGFDDVTVESPIKEEVGDDQIVYTFKVNPGMKYRVTNVQIEGMQHFDRDQGLKIMDMDSLLRLESPPLNHDLIRRGMDNLKAAYNAAGFWDAQVHSPRIAKDRNTGQASLVFLVQEGKQRVFEKLEVRGNKVLSDQEIADLLGTKAEKPLVWGDLLTLEQKLKAAYNKEGYLYATFKIDLVQKRELRMIPTIVMVEVNEEKRVKFGDITITGLVRTKQEVVRRELRFQTGDWYDPGKIDETRGALIRLGLFSSVSIIPSDSSAMVEYHDSIPYTIVLHEGKPGNISFGPGWSFDNGGRYSIETSYNNIGGMNRQVFIKGTLSEESRQDGFTNKTLLGRSLGGGYVEPYIFDLPVNGSITLNHRAEAGIKRWELSRQGEVALDHTLRHLITGAKIMTFYGQKITEVEAEEALKYNLIETGDVRTGRVGLRFNLDRRNDPSWPTSGYLLNLESAWARYYLGGDLQYFRWSVSNSHYFQLSQNFVLAAGVSFTAFDDVERRGDIPDVLPTTERLYAGGAETNRGFRRQELGPKINYWNIDEERREDLVAGGSRLAVYKLELRYQLIQDTMAITSFVDASDTFFTQSEFDRFEADFQSNPPPGQDPARMLDNSEYSFEEAIKRPRVIWDKNYVSYGLAFNYLTPLGSFNLSYGLPWKRCPTADDQCEDPRGNKVENGILGGVFHINVGANF